MSKKSVKINGNEYESVANASVKLNIGISRIKYCIKKYGRDFNYDFSISPHHQIVIDGVLYKNRLDAVRSSEITLAHSSIVKLTKENNIIDSSKVINRSLKSVTVNGVFYPSVNEAARQTTITAGRIWVAIRKQNSRIVVIPVIGPGNRGADACSKKLILNGETFKSISDASKITGLSYKLLRDLVKEQKSYDITYDGNRQLVEVTVNGQKYHSLMEAVLSTGFGLNTILRRMSEQKSNDITVILKK